VDVVEDMLGGLCMVVLVALLLMVVILMYVMVELVV